MELSVQRQKIPLADWAREFDLKGSEERTFFSDSLLELQVVDFWAGAMNLLVAISLGVVVKEAFGPV